jgi:hypothetical protein
MLRVGRTGGEQALWLDLLVMDRLGDCFFSLFSLKELVV